MKTVLVVKPEAEIWCIKDCF